MSLTRCKNCGADLAGANDAIRCPYCGTVYNTDSPASPVPPGSGDQPAKANANNPGNNSASTGTNKKKSSIYAWLFLFICIGALIIAIAVKRTNSELRNSLSDTTKDTLVNIPAEKADSNIHIKKTNPDPEIIIKRSRVYNHQGMTTISITVQNKTIPEDVVTDIAFTFEIFDKNGIELNTGESNEREWRLVLYKGHKTTEEWQTNELPKARTIKIKLKKVELGNTEWDY